MGCARPELSSESLEHPRLCLASRELTKEEVDSFLKRWNEAWGCYGSEST